jgi:hypothetical protein
MSATSSSNGAKRPEPRVAGQLAAEVHDSGLDLTKLQARINAVSDREGLPLTEEYLEQIESLRADLTGLLDAITRARVRAVLLGVEQRWTYERIGKATGLSKARIGQIAPQRPRAHPPLTQTHR